MKQDMKWNQKVQPCDIPKVNALQNLSQCREKIDYLLWKSLNMLKALVLPHKMKSVLYFPVS